MVLLERIELGQMLMETTLCATFRQKLADRFLQWREAM
jgi:hypothetical protein